MDVFLSILNINSPINLDTVAKKMQVVDRKQRISKSWPYNTVTRHQGKKQAKCYLRISGKSKTLKISKSFLP